MSSPFLIKSEVCRLTCRVRAVAQCRLLDRMSIPYIRDGDGWPLVKREYMYGKGARPAEFQPNWKTM